MSNSGRIAVVVLLLLSLFLFTVQTKNRLANRLFSLFLLFIAFDLSGFFMYGWFLNYPYLAALKTASSLLQMPLFYLYVLSICYYNFRLSLKHLWHGVVFGFLFLSLLTRLYALDKSAQHVFLTNTQTLFFLVFDVIGELQYFVYIGLTVLALRKYKNVYIENYSIAFDAFYRWIHQVIIVFVIAHLIALSKYFIQVNGTQPMIVWANMVVSLIALTISCWFVLTALYQPALFRGIDIRLETLPKNTNVPKETGLSELTSSQQQQIDTLKTFMQTQEPFLDASLNIQQLADALQLSTKELSQLINVCIGQNFFNFVNQYRIAKAQEILKNPSKKDVTVLEVLYEVGFNSKSSFNTAFKKHTGLTPTAFRKQHQS